MEQHEVTMKRIKQAMDNAELKACDLCDITGIGKTCISNYVTGRNVPTHANAVILGQALCVSPAWLLGYDVPMVDKVKEQKKEKDALQSIEKYLVYDLNFTRTDTNAIMRYIRLIKESKTNGNCKENEKR